MPGHRRQRPREDSAWAGFLIGALLGSFLFLGPSLVAGEGRQERKDKSEKKDKKAAPLSKAFRGKLPISELSEDEATLHALNRLSFGPRPSDVDRVKKMGLEKWVDAQLNPDSLDDRAMSARLEDYPALKLSTAQLLDRYPNPQQAAKREGISLEEYKRRLEDDGDKRKAPREVVLELSEAKILRAVYSERQLQEVMTDFWFNHFNVFAGKGAVKWMLPEYERDVIRPHTLGKFHDLLYATAKSPAMLFYLDNWLSADPKAYDQHGKELRARQRRFMRIFSGGNSRVMIMRRPNPNRPDFPRPQNRPQPGQPGQPPQPPQKRGLNENYGRELMELHTLGVDGGYTQNDVTQAAMALTGWTMRAPRRDPEFHFEDKIHGEEPKQILGTTIHSGGMKDGEQLLDLLVKHPSTAKFISTKLARRFVSDTPPEALVARMAQTFRETDGNIREVMKTMIYSPEFWSRGTFRAKIKKPFELVVSALRATGADIERGTPLVQWSARIGEPLYGCQPPTGYSDKADAWVNSGALLNRLNFGLVLASGKMNGAHVDVASLLGAQSSADPNAVLNRALDVLLGGQASPETRAVLEKQLNDPQVLQAMFDDPVKNVDAGLITGLVLGSPEFQRR